MFNQKYTFLSKIVCALPVALMLGLSGCGGSSGSGTTANTNTDGETLSALVLGYKIPTKISAVPEDNGAPQARAARISRSLAAIAASDLPATSDYALAVPRRYIEEQSLEQFDILEQVLSAFAQTHFADTANINAGPYKAMVAWEDEQDGRAIKQLQPWVVDSRMIVDAQGRDVNRVLVWIEESNPEAADGKELIKAEIKVYESATIDAEGTVTDYGVWDMNVMFGDGSDDYFTASSSTENGVNVLKVQDHFLEGPPDNEIVVAMKGVLYRSGTSGYGQVQYPDWESCWMNADANGGGCVPESITAQYSYNDGYMAVQQDADPVMYRDRGSNTAMTHRYGLFYKEADADNGIGEGDNLEKHLSFGFPVTFTDADTGFVQHAYYGAWQGRHELWGGGPNGQIAAGTVVTEEAFGDATPASYTVSAAFNGTFTRRTLSDADLNAIKGIPVETWINDNYELSYDVDTWKYCDGYIDWSTWPSVCRDRVSNNETGLTAFTDFASLVTTDGGRKHVNINRWDNNTSTNYDYVYLAADPQSQGFTFAGAGFYEAEWGNNGNMSPKVPAAKYTPVDGDGMWANIGGSIYIQYTGDFTNGKTGWVEKQLTSFVEQTWTPVFAAASNDVDFSPEQGNEYYINNQGANYIVRRVAPEDALASYEVKSELQTSANPVNYASLLPVGATYLRTPWRPEVKFSLVTTAGANFLKLVYLTDDPNTTENEIGTVYTSGEWGLQAFNASNQPLTADGTAVLVDEWGFPQQGQSRPAEFNWEYSTGGWGTQQFLIDSDNAYVTLSDPVQLQPFNATNGAGDVKVLSLAFDGWMHGMPDMYHELSKNNWVMTEEIADKIFNISAATVVTDANGVGYFVKPLDVSLFLDNVTEGEISGAGGTVPDITDAAQADLTTVPDLVPHGMGVMPTGTVVKYSEGKAVN